MRLNYFDYFRAIAIVFIIAGHCFHPWNINTQTEMVIANLISGGSALFVFISGFFFHCIFYPKFQLKKFLIKKTKNVFSPYIILSSVGFIIFIVVLKLPNPYISGNLDTFSNSVYLYFKYIWTGRVITAYWYIPFIMMVFLCSPIFLKYIEMSKKKQFYIFIPLITISILVGRPLNDMNPLHSFVYFTPIYLLGIIYSINEKKIFNFIKNKSLILGLITLSISIFQVVTYNNYGNNYSDTISFTCFDIILIQKIFMIFFFLSILRKLDNKEIPILKYIASVSFAIYFLHPWVLRGFSYLSVYDYVSFLPGSIIFLLNTLLVIGISLAGAKICKSIFGYRSRYIIGW